MFHDHDNSVVTIGTLVAEVASSIRPELADRALRLTKAGLKKRTFADLAKAEQLAKRQAMLIALATSAVRDKLRLYVKCHVCFAMDDDDTPLWSVVTTQFDRSIAIRRLNKPRVLIRQQSQDRHLGIPAAETELLAAARAYAATVGRQEADFSRAITEHLSSVTLSNHATVGHQDGPESTQAALDVSVDQKQPGRARRNARGLKRDVRKT